MKRPDLQAFTKKALQNHLELRTQKSKSSENMENGSMGQLSSKEETNVESPASPSPCYEVDENISFFIDFRALY